MLSQMNRTKECLDMSAVLQVNDRDKTAKRLLASSAKNSYDPELDIDWDSADTALAHMPLHRVSLCGSPLWDTLTEEQRVTLSKAEITSVARVGLWFEILLMGMLAWMGEKILDYLAEVGMLNRTARFLYRRASLLP
jgi:hypothetical protein